MDPSDKVKRLVRPEIQALTAYHVPDPGDLVKLDAMENPWSWPETLRAEWCAALESVSLNRYPDPGARDLQAAMRQAMGVPETAAIVLGNGSDELIQMIIQTLASPGRTVMAPEPTFVMYRQLALVAGMAFAGVPLQKNFSLDEAAMLEAITMRQPAVVFLAYPNNPTGNLFDAGVVRRILDKAPGLVVIDEAYAPFTDASFMAELPEHDNLLVLRTVSKMGLAGLRLGLLAGPPDWLAQIDKTRLPYNLGSLNQATGRFALQHKSVFDLQAGLIRQDRADLLAALQALPGLTVSPSEANFILFRAPRGQAPGIHAGLQDAGILIKILDGSAPALADCLRVTVGTAEENRLFLTALAKLLPGA